MKVLVVDDDPVSRRLLQVSLGQAGYEPAIVDNGARAVELLGQPDAPRLVVLDWMMPDMDGVEVCRAIRRRPPEPYVYVLLLTAKGRLEDIIEGLDAGADDYVTKPCDVRELTARLRAGRRILELQDQLVEARERLRIEATHDSLTGLLNHGAVLDTLHREVLRSAREGTDLAVIMADLDHFKLVNDTHGHAVGDEVLKEAARRARVTVRGYDSIGRYGGEEFLVVVPRCRIPAGAELAERLRVCVCEHPFHASIGEIAVTISLGVAASQSPTLPHASLLHAADEALYRAKSAGRNRVEVAGPDGPALERH